MKRKNGIGQSGGSLLERAMSVKPKIIGRPNAMLERDGVEELLLAYASGKVRRIQAAAVLGVDKSNVGPILGSLFLRLVREGRVAISPKKVRA